LKSGSLQQNVIDAAINEWRKRLCACVQMDNILNIYCERIRVTDKSYGQIKYK